MPMFKNRFIRYAMLFVGRALAAVLLLLFFLIIVTGVSPIYDFAPCRPFEGPDIFNPYRNIDTAHCWKRANFHTHTRVEGMFNECEMWPGEVYREYMKYGYDIVTFSNHNEITEHPFDKELQANVYEHGYNLLKFHKLVFGSEGENGFDNLLPLLHSQRQFQLDMLRTESDIVVYNHPYFSALSNRRMFEKLDGYHIVELDGGQTTENEHWDWALSAGHYCFGLANDDMHNPRRSWLIAVRCNFLCTPSASYEDIRRVLLDGCYYAMRVPDYGKGDWEQKIKGNRSLPYITGIGVKGDSVYVSVSEPAARIKVTGQGHDELLSVYDTDHAGYVMGCKDSYARFTIYFEGGEVIYTNPFARYDASASDMPGKGIAHSVNIALTILYNLMLVLLAAGLLWLLYRLLLKRFVNEKILRKNV